MAACAYTHEHWRNKPADVCGTQHLNWFYSEFYWSGYMNYDSETCTERSSVVGGVSASAGKGLGLIVEK